MKNNKHLLASLVSFALMAPVASHAGWNDWVNKAKEVAQENGVPGLTEDKPAAAAPAAASSAASAASPAAPSAAENVTGLRSAIASFTEAAVQRLGKEDGFMQDSLVRIPVPEQLQTLKKGLAAVGQEGLVDDFELSMNRAAEQAVKDAAPVFGKAVQDMSIEDASNIIRGEKNAATQYFRGKTSDDLRQRMLPQVQQVIEKTGATRYYQQIMGQAGGLSSFLSKDTMNLDEYVTDQSLNSLFTVMEQEEARLRENPAGAATDLVKKVFSWFE